MFDKCIKCERLGQDCMPNLMILSFGELIAWCNKRQKDLGWTNQTLADRSTVAIGTINRIKVGDYADCKYSTIRNLLVALIGGISTEFPCKEKLENELKMIDSYNAQREKLLVLEKENQELRTRLDNMDELHRSDIRAVKTEYVEQIRFLKDELIAWRERGSK